MTYQNKLRPWCIVQQLPEMKRVIIDRFRHYQDADARAKFLGDKTPSASFVVLFAPDAPVVAATPAVPDAVAPAH
ncbi:MAG: hypothetical protein AAF773_13960 [Cyanobacteria bacterium P01_D01_bin.115]